jgi:hypothetical protein
VNVIIIRVVRHPGRDIYLLIGQDFLCEFPGPAMKKLRSDDLEWEDLGHVVEFVRQLIHLRRIAVRRQASRGQVECLRRSYAERKNKGTMNVCRKPLDEDPT